MACFDEQYVDYRMLAEGDSLAVEPGVHTVRIATEHYPDAVFQAPLEAATVSLYRLVYTDPLDPSKPRPRPSRAAYLAGSSYPPLVEGVNLSVISDPESVIYVDGSRAGTGSVRVQVAAGEHEVVVVHPEAGTPTERVVVPAEPPRLVETKVYVRPLRSVAMTSQEFWNSL